MEKLPNIVKGELGDIPCLRGLGGGILLPIIVIISLAISSCKKYEKGPDITLRTPKSRIERKWKLWSKYENGKEILLYDYDFERTWDFKSKDSLFYDERKGNVTLEWVFSEDYKSVIISGEINLLYNYLEKWDIIKLTPNEFWFRQNAGVWVYETHMIAAK
ncbi:MAG: hypothetical protein NTX03_15130 [Bacteroidetes bacterium]|nr:hypothetical protein [Bacteroidota bacterium]